MTSQDFGERTFQASRVARFVRKGNSTGARRQAKACSESAAHKRHRRQVFRYVLGAEQLQHGSHSLLRLLVGCVDQVLGAAAVDGRPQAKALCS